MKHFKVSITNPDTDQVEEAHVVMNLNIELFRKGEDPADFVQTGDIIIRPYKSKAQIVGKKMPGAGASIVHIPDLTQLPSYPALVQEAIGLVLADPRFAGAEIDDTNEVVE